MKKLTGKCLCGAIAYEIHGNLAQLLIVIVLCVGVGMAQHSEHAV